MVSLAKVIRGITDRHQLWSVWSDLVEMAAIAISNTVDLVQRPQREARYEAIAAKYEAPERERFAQAFGAVVLEMENGIDDVLGRTFMELELGNKWAGQFFTPFAVCRMMAAVSVPDLLPQLAERGFVTASDPAVGGGAMPLALCAHLKDIGVNYQQALHVTAQDIDERAAHMAYIQLSLVHVPAVIVVGDTLRMECRALWYTPAHVLGGWSMRLAARDRRPQPQPTTEPAAPSPPQLALF